MKSLLGSAYLFEIVPLWRELIWHVLRLFEPYELC